MATALAQARGYGVGMVLAHQNLAQLKDAELAEAVDANCQTKLCFGLGAADAKRMAVHFQPRLDAHDLLHLQRTRSRAASLHDTRSYPPRPRPRPRRPPTPWRHGQHDPWRARANAQRVPGGGSDDP